MKPDAHQLLERYRIRQGRLASDSSIGNNGAFLVPVAGHEEPRIEAANRTTRVLGIIVSYGACWDHISVSLPNRCPTWEEMCFVKDLFFEPHEPAMQLHPPRSEYVNHHPFCLHLWRPHGKSIPLPPSELVGPK